MPPLIICAPKRKSLIEIVEGLKYDPYWSNTTLLTRGESVTTPIDEAGAQITATNAKNFSAGQSLAYFTGSGSFLTVSPINLTGQCCVEARVFPTLATRMAFIATNRPSSGNTVGWSFYMASDLTLVFNIWNTTGSESWMSVASSTAIPVNEWSHVAGSFDGTTMRVFINGKLVGSTTVMTGTRSSSNNNVVIGRDPIAPTTRDWPGFMSNVRITNGAPRYTADFTPPASLADDPDQAYTALALGLETDLVDTLGRSTVTPTNVVRVPMRSDTSSVTYLNGNNSYLSVPNNNQKYRLEGDFTLEASVFLFSVSGSYGSTLFRSWYPGNAGECSWGLGVSSARAVVCAYRVGGTDYAATSANGVVPLNTWCDFVVTRTGSTVTIYMNNELVAQTVLNTSSSNPTSAAMYLGGHPEYASLSVNGFLSNARITKGVARYAPRGTLSSVSLTKDADTIYGLKGTGTVGSTTVEEETGAAVTNNGGVQIAADGPFGTCLSFNGSNSLALPSTGLMDFGYGDFTLETRIRLKSLTVGRIISRQRIGVADYAVSLQLTSSGQVQLLLRTAPIALATYTSTTALTVGQWAHIAAVRRKGTVYILVNGVVEAVGTSTHNLIDAASDGVTIGRFSGTPAEFINADLDELWISKTARYMPTTRPSYMEYDHRHAEYYWENIAFQLRADDPSFTDVRGSLVTNGGAVTSATDKVKFLNAATKFTGAVQSRLTVAGNSRHAFASGEDFTYEVLVNFDTLSTVWNGESPSNQYIMDIGANGTAMGWNCAGGWFFFNANSSLNLRALTPAPVVGRWYHFAVSRVNGTCRMFIDGVQVASAAYTGAVGTAQTMTVGNSGYTPAGLAGRLEMFRITRAGRYAAPFSVRNQKYPDAPASVDVRWLSTKLLLDKGLDAVAGRNVTSSGVSADFQTTRNSTQSMRFETTSSSLSVPNCVFGIGASSDYTIEFSVRFSSINTGSNTFVNKWVSWMSNIDFDFDISGGKIRYLVGNASVVLTALSAVETNVWYHVAAVRRNGTTTLYINGVPQASSTVAYTLTDNQTTLSIGKYGSTGGHVFNMEEFRVTRAARYFGSFVAPERAMPTKG